MRRTPVSPAEPPLWRAAFPLLVVGAASFVIAYLVARAASHAEFGHLPLWGFFAAIGAVITGGGVTVLVAGREAEPEERPPFYDPREYVLVPRARYERLVERTQPPEPAPRAAFRSTQQPWSEEESTLPRAPPAQSPRREAPTARARSGSRPGFSPAPDFLPQVDAAIGEMEDLLKELREEGFQEARILGTTEPRRREEAQEARPPPAPPAPKPPASAAPPSPARAARPAAGPAMSTPARPVAAAAPVAPRRPKLEPAAAELNTCLTCGKELAAPATAHRCSVCGGPMCSVCLGRARRAGHAGVCSRCAALLPKGDGEAAAGSGARPGRKPR